MKDHEIAAFVNELTSISRRYVSHQSLRDRISRCVINKLTAYPRNFREFEDSQKDMYRICTNCSMPFTDECNRDPEEWIRATSKGICGKCHEEITDHLSGDSDV